MFNSKQVALGTGSIVLASASLLAFVGNWEGNKPVAYADALAYGVPTVCGGHTGPDVRVGDVWSKAKCDAVLHKDVVKHGAGILACTKVPINQNTYNALTSWAFNVGLNAACESTLIKLLNAGDLAGACDQLLRWDMAGGVHVRGLQNRRQAEKAQCLRPVVQSLGAQG